MGDEMMAKCPRCEQWSPVYWFTALPPGGYWWATAGCPRCGAVVLVETECEFKRAEVEAAVEAQP